MEPQSEADRIDTELLQQELAMEREITKLREATGYSRALNDTVVQVKRKILDLRDRVEQLSLIAEEAETDGDRDALLAVQNKHRKALVNAENSLQLAKLERKRGEEERHERNRALLLEGSEEVLMRRRERQREHLAEASAEITSSLRRAREQLAAEVERSTASLRQMDESSGRIRRTNDQIAALDSRVVTGGSIVSRLDRRETTDRLLLALSVVFFTLVVLYILKSRITG